MSLGTQFRKLSLGASRFRQAMWGETITIGTWTGRAEVTSGSAAAPEFVVGGEYDHAELIALVQKSDLPAGFTPTVQMAVTARDLSLRISPEGLTEHPHAWRLVLVARHVPAAR